MRKTAFALGLLAALIIGYQGQRYLLGFTWATAGRSRTARVRLRTIPQPPPYEKAIARPRTFDDPQWPFTFTYPNGWSLKVSDSTFLLQSADPFDMCLSTWEYR